jgi:hypothetical protein
MSLISDSLVSRPLRDRHGELVGHVTAWYRYPQELDAPTGAAAVRTGRVLRTTHLVDLHDASLEGEAIVVIYPIDLITSAPNYRPLVGNTLSPHDAAAVLAHYRASMAQA